MVRVRPQKIPLLSLAWVHRFESRFVSLDGVVALYKCVQFTVQVFWAHSFLLHDMRVGVVRWLEVVPAIASLWHPTLVSTTLEARLVHHLAKATLLEIVSALDRHLTISLLHVLTLAGVLLLYTK